MRIKIQKKGGTKGIYYLYRDNIVVYVGQSSSCEKRATSHLENKDFDEYEIVEVTDEPLNEIEAREIVKYKPEYNKSLPKNKLFVSLKTFLFEVNGKMPSSTERRIAKIFSAGIKPIIIQESLYFKRSDLESIEIF